MAGSTWTMRLSFLLNANAASAIVLPNLDRHLLKHYPVVLLAWQLQTENYLVFQHVLYTTRFQYTLQFINHEMLEMGAP